MKDIHEINLFDVEDLISSKVMIEQKLIDKGYINEKLSLQDFVAKYISIDNIYMYKQNESVPFVISNIADDDYLIICTENKEYKNKLTTILKRINYDLSKLHSIDEFPDKTILDFDNVFYINGKIYIA